MRALRQRAAARACDAVQWESEESGEEAPEDVHALRAEELPAVDLEVPLQAHFLRGWKVLLDRRLELRREVHGRHELIESKTLRGRHASSPDNDAAVQT